MSTALEITRRIIGVVLQHKNDETITRTIFTYLTPERGYCRESLIPIYPQSKFLT